MTDQLYLLRQRRRILLRMFLALALMAPVTASAISLEDAKKQGLVGEKPDGYLGVVATSPDAESVANEVNSKRKERYFEIAKTSGTSINAVEVLAGKKAIEKTERGHFIQLPNGSWVKK